MCGPSHTHPHTHTRVLGATTRSHRLSETPFLAPPPPPPPPGWQVPQCEGKRWGALGDGFWTQGLGAVQRTSGRVRVLLGCSGVRRSSATAELQGRCAHTVPLLFFRLGGSVSPADFPPGRTPPPTHVFSLCGGSCAVSFWRHPPVRWVRVLPVRTRTDRGQAEVRGPYRDSSPAGPKAASPPASGRPGPFGRIPCATALSAPTHVEPIRAQLLPSSKFDKRLDRPPRVECRGGSIPWDRKGNSSKH